MGMRITWLMRLSLMLLAVVTLAATNTARAEEKEETIKIEDLPAKVREAVKLATAGGDIEKVELSSEDGKKVYEIEAEVEGGTVELVFNGDGQLIGIEVANDERTEEADDDDEDGEGEHGEGEHGSEVVKKITLDDVPSAARTAISKRAGDAKIVGVESITEAGHTVYEAAWMKGDKKIEVLVSAAGSLIAEESSLTLDQMPKELRAIAKKFAGKAELKLERKTIVLYELEKATKGKEVEIYVDATGREVKVSVGSGDDHHDEAGNDDDDDEHEEDDDDKK